MASSSTSSRRSLILFSVALLLAGCERSEPPVPESAQLQPTDLLDALIEGGAQPQTFEWQDDDVTDLPEVLDDAPLTEPDAVFDAAGPEPAEEGPPAEEVPPAQEQQTEPPPQQPEDGVLCQDDPEDENCIPIAATCDCQRGAFTFNANARNPFATNPMARSPNLNGPNPQRMGPCTGFYGVPQGGQVVRMYRMANTFLVDFPLNGVHTCSSEQVFVEWRYTFDTRNNRLVRIAYEKGPDGPPPAGMQAQNFFGNTRTGVRALGGFNYYEGTANNLAWWDSPGTRTRVVPGGSPFVEVKLLILLSVAKRPNGTYCKCYSNHMFAVQLGVGAAPNPLLAPLLAQPNLQRVAVQATLVASQTLPARTAGEVGAGAFILQLMMPAQNPHFESRCR